MPNVFVRTLFVLVIAFVVIMFFILVGITIYSAIKIAITPRAKEPKKVYPSHPQKTVYGLEPRQERDEDNEHTGDDPDGYAAFRMKQIEEEWEEKEAEEKEAREIEEWNERVDAEREERARKWNDGE